MASKKKNPPPATPAVPRVKPVPQVPPPNPRGMMRTPLQGAPIDAQFEGDDMMGAGAFGIDPAEKITTWIENVFARNRPVEFRLRLATFGNDGTGVHEWGSDDIEGNDPATIAQNIYETASGEANETGGHVRFAIWACGPGETTPFMRMTFSVTAENMATPFDNEPGHTAEGQMAQAHRHVEVMMRMHVGMVTDTMRVYREQNRELSERANKALDYQFRTAELHQQLLDRQMIRDLNIKKAESMNRRKEQMLDYMMQFLPDVAAKFGLVPGGMKDLDKLMDAYGAMSDEQADFLIANIEDPEQREAAKRFRTSAKTRADDKRRKAMMGSTPKQLAEGSPAKPKGIDITLDEEEIKTLKTLVFVAAQTFARMPANVFEKLVTNLFDASGGQVAGAARNAILEIAKAKRQEMSDAEIKTFVALEPYVLGLVDSDKLDEFLQYLPAPKFVEIFKAMRTAISAKKASKPTEPEKPIEKPAEKSTDEFSLEATITAMMKNVPEGQLAMLLMLAPTDTEKAHLKSLWEKAHAT